MSETETTRQLMVNDAVAVRYSIKTSLDPQFKIVKVKEILKDGIIDTSDKVWRRKEIVGHATMQPANLFQHLCNAAKWEIREIFWDSKPQGAQQ